jgi:CheY-like chemotaxis protein
MGLAGVVVLLVDDDEATRYWMTRLLEKEGAQVEGAATAGEAMEALDRRQPDVILCDIAMPGEDGFDVIRRVRSRGASAGGGIPAVAVTAYAVTPDLIDSTLAAGFQAHMAKPFEPDDLVRVVTQIVRPA